MSVAKKTLHQKLIEFHLEVGTIRKNGTNPHFESKYADINAVLSVIMPVLTAKGIVVMQLPKVTEQGSFILDTVLTNSDDKDDMIVSTTPLLMPDKTNPQKYGSALTYARRYALMCMLDLEAEDDDGNYANQSPQGGNYSQGGNYPQQQYQRN